MELEHTAQFLQTFSHAATAKNSSPVAVLRDMYGSITKGDFGALSNFLAEDVELTICGFEPMAGKWRGCDGVIEAAKTNFGRVEKQRPVVEKIVADGDCVVILLRENGVVIATGEPYCVRVAQWFTFADGKITKVEQIAAPEAA